MVTIYHNPRCRKSREGLAYLEKKNIEINIIDYQKNPLTVDELKDVLIKLNKKPQDIIRTQEPIYKSNFKGKNFTDDEWVQIIVEYPKLIERPNIVKKYRAVIARPLENIDELF